MRAASACEIHSSGEKLVDNVNLFTYSVYRARTIGPSMNSGGKYLERHSRCS
jgi:hypothetical protein